MTFVGLIGFPVGHSLSPKMHNAAFEACDMNWEYRLLPIRHDQLAVELGKLRTENWRGVNVTVPHKEAVMAHLDDFDVTAREVGAVNTIVNDGGRLKGYNTDVSGFLESLKVNGFDANGCHAVVLGAGGAARAVVYALVSRGASVAIANRDARRAESIALKSGARFDCEIPIFALHDSHEMEGVLRNSNLLVNCTSAGMHPDTENDPLPPSVRIPAGILVYDLIYKPRETRLLRRAEAAGARTMNGIRMLVHQGAAAFSLWTGRDAPVDVMRAAIE